MKGSCHCGKVEFLIKVSEGDFFKDIYRCDCSLCINDALPTDPAIEYDIHSSVPWLLQAFVIATWVFISYSSLHIKSAYFIRDLSNKITTTLLGLIK